MTLAFRTLGHPVCIISQAIPKLFILQNHNGKRKTERKERGIRGSKKKPSKKKQTYKHTVRKRRERNRRAIDTLKK